MKKEIVLETTRSICPVCRKVLEARIVEEGGSVYMVKNCPEHGAFKTILSKYDWYYKGLNFLYDKISPAGHPLTDKTARSILFHPTSKCNLGCSICFSHTKSAPKDIPLDEVSRMAKSIKSKKTIVIVGGEPTVHKDITEIVKIFSKAGHFVEFFTNGIKLEDLDYLKRLKKSGVGIVQIGVDSLSDDEVYRTMRGEVLLERKEKALSNLRALGIKTGVVGVVLKGFNEKDIPEITDFVIKNRFLHELSLRGYSYLGRKGFSLENEFTMDELVETFEKQTGGLVTLEEFYTFQRISYILRAYLYNTAQCYVNQHILIPRGRNKKVRDIFPPDVFEKHIKTFEDIFARDPRKARIFFLSKVFARVPRGLSLFFQKGLAGKVPYFDARYYVELEFAMFYTPYNIDLVKTKKRCSDAWLPSYADGKLEDYCNVLSRTDGL
jgi:uncharacterized radical SAM superfamily Fe-S cluster-containing enzyme